MNGVYVGKKFGMDEFCFVNDFVILAKVKFLLSGSSLEPLISLDLVSAKLYCFRARVYCYCYWYRARN